MAISVHPYAWYRGHSCICTVYLNMHMHDERECWRNPCTVGKKIEVTVKILY